MIVEHTAGDGALGRDTLRNIEFIEFTDKTISVEDLRNDDGGSAAGDSAGKVFLADGGAFTLNETAQVFGGDGDEHVYLAESVTNVTTDANLERLDIARAFADLDFQVTDAGLTITAGGTTVAAIPSLNQSLDLRVAEGSATLTQTGAQRFELTGANDSSAVIDSEGGDTEAIELGTPHASRPTDAPAEPSANVFLNSGASFTVAQPANVFGDGEGEEALILADGSAPVQTDANIERLDIAESLSDLRFHVTEDGFQVRSQAGTTLATLPSVNQEVSLRFTGGEATLSQTGAERFTLTGANGDTDEITPDSGGGVDIDLGNASAAQIELAGLGPDSGIDGI